MTQDDPIPMSDVPINDNAAEATSSEELDALRTKLVATEQDLHNHKRNRRHSLLAGAGLRRAP
jgi:hypothetical protein